MEDISQHVRPGKGLIASDLHLGQYSAEGEKALREIRAEIRRIAKEDEASTKYKAGQGPSLIILNGDIIEGKELTGTRGDLTGKLDYFTKQIRELVKEAVYYNPDVKIAYIYGNHDAYQEIRARLDALALESNGHFSAHSDYVRLHNVMHTHGDLQMKFKDADHELALLGHMVMGTKQLIPSGRMERTHWGHIQPRSGARAATQHAVSAISNRVDQTLSPVIYPLDQVSGAFLDHFRTHDPQAMEGVDTVMIGHIHSPYASKHTRDGVDFRVTGPATRYSKNTMYRFDIGSDRVSNYELFGEKRGAAR